MESLCFAEPAAGFQPSPAEDGEGGRSDGLTLVQPESCLWTMLPTGQGEGGCCSPQMDFVKVETEVLGGDGTCLRFRSQVAEVQMKTQVSAGPFRASAQTED